MSLATERSSSVILPARTSMSSPVCAEKYMRSPPVLRMSLLLSASMMTTPGNPFLTVARSLSCISMGYPQVSEGSSTKSMTSVRYLSARTACLSMAFLSSNSLSRSPGVSMIWYLLQSSWMWPTMMPLVVNGYGAISGSAEESTFTRLLLPTFGNPATTSVGSLGSTAGSLRNLFLASCRNSRSSEMRST